MLDINEALNRWTEEILPSKSAFKKALSQKKLTIYHGIDPTGTDLHLGHSTNYLLMRVLQDAGHKIILLIGDFTAQIGDPSDKSAARRRLSKKEIAVNLKNYQKQVGKILRLSGENAVTVKFNSQWLSSLSFQDVIELAAEFTVQQIIERDIFQRRLADKKPLWLHEFLYPLAQGYDSVALKTDAEIGGTDQTFNMLAGRTMVRNHLKKEKFTISTPLLINPKTGTKMMSKSEGNYIALSEKPSGMFDKVMALADEIIIPCLVMCTTVPMEQIRKLEEGMERGELNPIEAKKKLGWEIVRLYHGEEAANRAREEFEGVFQKGETPSSVPVYTSKSGKINLINVLLESKQVKSRSEAKRLIKQGGVEWNGKRIASAAITVENSATLKIGKYRFLRINKAKLK